MDKPFDPNVPDCRDGDFFCKLCLASMNSESMWSSHIVGKRHIKNMAAFPNGLPRAKFDDENSYDRPPKMGRYEDMDDYPPPPSNYPEDYPDYPVYPDYYEEEYYNRRPTVYVPEVRRVVVHDYGHKNVHDDGNKNVHDYGHKKVDDPILKSEPKNSEGYLNGGKKIEKIDIDSIIDEVKKSVSKENGGQVEEEPKKDDFFEKLNEKFLAEDLAEEITKKRLQEQKNKVQYKQKPTESSKEQKNDDRHSKEKKNRDILPDGRDSIYKSSKSSSSKSSSSKSSPTSSSKKPPIRLDKIDPDDLTPDMLDDLLSSYLKPKIDSMAKEKVTTFDKEPKKKEADLDDKYVLATKISDLPTKTFLQLTLEKMRHINLKDSEELQMIFQIICQAQNIICKKLPPQLQAVVKDKMSRNYSNTESEIPSTSVSQQSTVAPISNQILTANVPQTSIAASYSSLIQNAASTLNTTAVSSAVQIQQPIMTQAAPITSISLPMQSTPVLQSSTNQSFPQLPMPQLPMYPPPVYPTSLSTGAIPPHFYSYMYGTPVFGGSFPSATGVPLNFAGYQPSLQTGTSTTVSQSQPTCSTSCQQKITNKKVPLIPSPPRPCPPGQSLLYERFVASTSLQNERKNSNFNLIQVQLNKAQTAGVQSDSVNNSTVGQNRTDTNYYPTIHSTVGNTVPGVSPSTTSVAPVSRNTEAALASLKTLAEEYASKNSNSSEESEKKTQDKRSSRWR